MKEIINFRTKNCIDCKFSIKEKLELNENCCSYLETKTVIENICQQKEKEKELI